MERLSVSEMIDHYQPLLRQYEKDDGLILLDAEEEPGTKAGENYMSVVMRTMITGKRGNGSPYRKSFMRKMLLENSQFSKIFRNDELFRTESHFYDKLMPLLGSFGPECVLAQPREIIMEDLRARDFAICERRKLLDLEHCSAVIETLASMHAASLCLKLKRPKDFAELVSPLGENIFPANENCTISMFYESSVEFALRSLESIENRTPKVERATDFIRNYVGRVKDVMKDLLTYLPDCDRYWVITHGDTWNNNILFLHDAQQKVVRVKLVDYQVARHSSPAFDFTYFFYSSARPEVMDHDTERIVSTYEQFFLHDLRRLDAPERDLEAFARPGWFKDEVRRYGLFGFFGALMVMHAVFTDEDRAVDIEMGSQDNDIDKCENPIQKIPLMPEKTDRILFITDHYIRHFVDSR